MALRDIFLLSLFDNVQAGPHDRSLFRSTSAPLTRIVTGTAVHVPAEQYSHSRCCPPQSPP